MLGGSKARAVCSRRDPATPPGEIRKKELAGQSAPEVPAARGGPPPGDPLRGGETGRVDEQLVMSPWAFSRAVSHAPRRLRGCPGATRTRAGRGSPGDTRCPDPCRPRRRRTRCRPPRSRRPGFLVGRAPPADLALCCSGGLPCNRNDARRPFAQHVGQRGVDRVQLPRRYGSLLPDHHEREKICLCPRGIRIGFLLPDPGQSPAR